MKHFKSDRLHRFYEQNKNKVRLLISCPDQPGIVSSVSQYLHKHGANIVQSAQYSMDPEGGLFFMRIEFELPNLEQTNGQLEAGFPAVAEPLKMSWKFTYVSHLKRMAIFVSRQEHCLLELLWQWQAGDLMAEIPMVISNHPHLRSTVEDLGIPFHHIPVTKENKAEAEQEQLDLLENRVDFIVLARYMQILSPSFVEHYPQRVINIHHSFLPAFMGGRPYERAYDRGVKLIGATSHYVTDDLDEGPIIEQDIERVNHKHNVDDLKRIGGQIERVVLARAVRWHLEDRIIVHQNKTVVFD